MALASASKAHLPMKRSSTSVGTVCRRCLPNVARRETSDPSAGSPEDDEVYCDYEAYGFKVRNRIVRVCFFWEEWKGPIRGIKIGDSREDVVRVLGKAPTTVKDKDGVVIAYGYKLKDMGANFFANFDKNGKVVRVEVSLK
jgi:hypothetical protein